LANRCTNGYAITRWPFPWERPVTLSRWRIFPIAASSSGWRKFRILTELLRVGIDGSQLPPDSLASVVYKALRTKVSKLGGTIAKRRILLLERREWTLSEDWIDGEIELRRSSFPALNQIHEIWFANTVAYKRSKYVRLSERRDGHPVRVLAFRKGRLRERDGA
jgi:hypothetical protein